MASEGDVFRSILYLAWLQVRAVIWVFKMIFGIFMFWRMNRPPKPQNFTLQLASRLEHTHVVAGSGHGKTQLLQTMIMLLDLEEVAAGRRSVVVMDSQGDMLKTILQMAVLAPSQFGSLSDRLVLIDPNDIENPPCLNLFDFGLDRLDKYTPVEREKLVNGAIALYEYMFGALLGAELTNRQGVIFRYLARLMMVVPGATIYTMMDFMENPETIRPYLPKLDFATQRFLTTQFFSSSFDNTRQQILTRLWGVLSNSVLARMFSHSHNKLNIFEAMNKGSIILIHTAKDLLKQEGCEIFGRFMVALISQATQERSAILEEKRRPTLVYIDEAQDYFDAGLEQLLNTARKYAVGLILAHQNLHQFETKLRETVMSSTAVKYAGGVSSSDARDFAREMNTTPEFIQGMQKGPSDTRFALFVRNVTPEAIEFSVPLGLMETRARMPDSEMKTLLEKNRSKFCAPYERDLLAGSQALVTAGVSFDLEEPSTL